MCLDTVFKTIHKIVSRANRQFVSYGKLMVTRLLIIAEVILTVTDPKSSIQLATATIKVKALVIFGILGVISFHVV